MEAVSVEKLIICLSVGRDTQYRGGVGRDAQCRGGVGTDTDNLNTARNKG